MSEQMLPFWRAARVPALAVLLGLSLTSVAAPTLDTSFGTNGIVEQPFLGMGSYVRKVLGLRDGKILAVGDYVYGHGGRGGVPLTRGVLVRYSPDGSPDANFGSQGYLDPSIVYPQLLQRDGKMVRISQTGLVRFNADASPDTGIIADSAAGIPWFADMNPTYLAQQADGRIVVAGTVGAGTAALVLVRFNPDGSLDSSFNYGGALIVPHGDSSSNDLLAELLIQPDGKLVMAATSDTGIGTPQKFILVRYNPDGSPDSKFGSSGRASARIGINTQDNAVAVVRQPEGRLVVVGSTAVSTNDFNASTSALLLVGFTPDGVVDGAFGNAGAVTITTGNGTGGLYVNDAKLQADGKLLVTFSSPNLFFADRVIRFALDGAPDIAFGNVGTLMSHGLSHISTIELQTDGNLILGGNSLSGNFALELYISGPVAAVEFYHGALDHYFLSMNPQEVDDLDLGVHVGWTRTDQSFQVFGSAASAAGTSANPVCRFYIPPEHGDSHFFSADFRECQQVLSNMIYVPSFSGYVEETSNAFYVTLPDLLTGACPAATVPVYRLWNQRFDSNHRYTTSLATKAQMVARGYVAEGYGPNAVDMCAPQ